MESLIAAPSLILHQSRKRLPPTTDPSKHISRPAAAAPTRGKEEKAKSAFRLLVVVRVGLHASWEVYSGVWVMALSLLGGGQFDIKVGMRRWELDV